MRALTHTNICVPENHILGKACFQFQKSSSSSYARRAHTKMCVPENHILGKACFPFKKKGILMI
jgi:hypothetical protein